MKNILFVLPGLGQLMVHAQQQSIAVTDSTPVIINGLRAGTPLKK